jgi:uncharacterized protein
MLVDSHCHIFTNRIVENMLSRPAMVSELHLNVHDARPRLVPSALQESAQANGIHACVMLPTAAPDKVRQENDRFIGWTTEFPRLRTLATLHPAMPSLSDEVLRMFDHGIFGFKLSSFSQRFDVSSQEARTMLLTVERLAAKRSVQPTVVLDTFARADSYFGTDFRHTTRPAQVAALVHHHPGINFIAAHMGGLLARPDEVLRELVPSPNLYLDTSNATHTLQDNDFIELLRAHGASHILFGTDWPWFTHTSEMPLVGSLLERAGYTAADHMKVFGDTACRLFGL